MTFVTSAGIGQMLNFSVTARVREHLMRILILMAATLLPLVVLANDAKSVSVTTYRAIALHLEHQAAARVESLNEAVLSAEVTARVIEIPVRVGQRVAEGEILVRLDPDSFRIQRDQSRARLEGASAALDMARLRAERARRLAPEQFVSEDQLLEAETRLRQATADRTAAQADLELAELLLSRSDIVSPFDGVVSQRLIGVGALATAGSTLLELVATDRLEISAGLAPSLADGLEAADAIEFVSNGRRLAVRLARLAPIISRANRQQEARLEFVDQAAVPGSEGRIEWRDPRPAMPADFIVQRNGQLGVLVLEGDPVPGTTQQVGWIALPDADAGRPVRVDLDLDVMLIDQGRQRVRPGQSVRVE